MTLKEKKRSREVGENLETVGNVNSQVRDSATRGGDE